MGSRTDRKLKRNLDPCPTSSEFTETYLLSKNVMNCHYMVPLL